MRRPKFKHGVYEERARPVCKKCSLTYPECKHTEPPKRVVAIKGPLEIWCQLNGTAYPSVLYRNFNDFSVVEMVVPETQFRSRFVYIGRYTTTVTRTETLNKKGE